jgi:hypothetical protein
MDRAHGLAQLALADAHIARCEQFITRQEAIVERGRKGGHDVAEAQRLLILLTGSLEQFLIHRATIAAKLA